MSTEGSQCSSVQYVVNSMYWSDRLGDLCICMPSYFLSFLCLLSIAYLVSVRLKTRCHFGHVACKLVLTPRSPFQSFTNPHELCALKRRSCKPALVTLFRTHKQKSGSCALSYVKCTKAEEVGYTRNNSTTPVTTLALSD